MEISYNASSRHAPASQDLIHLQICVNPVFAERLKCRVSISANARGSVNVTNDIVAKTAVSLTIVNNILVYVLIGRSHLIQ